MTINLNQFFNLNKFKEECFVLNNDNFWLHLFLMCCVFYTRMRLLRLANLQSAAMDKLYFYVLQTDPMMVRWLPNCKQKSKELPKNDSLCQVMSTFDVDVDWSNNEEIANADNDDDKEGGDDSLNNNDSDLDIVRKEENEEEDDAYDFSIPEQVLVVCIIDCQLLYSLMTFLFPKVTWILRTMRETIREILS